MRQTIKVLRTEIDEKLLEYGASVASRSSLDENYEVWEISGPKMKPILEEDDAQEI